MCAVFGGAIRRIDLKVVPHAAVHAHRLPLCHARHPIGASCFPRCGNIRVTANRHPGHSDIVEDGHEMFLSASAGEKDLVEDDVRAGGSV